MLSTLADVALSVQPYFSERPNPAVTTSSLTLNFISAARLGDWIVAETVIDRLGKRSAQVHGRIQRDGDTLATMSGVFAIHRQPDQGRQAD
jgi:acyl-coenzyme A thioesterase PaaI-like protein